MPELPSEEEKASSSCCPRVRNEQQACLEGHSRKYISSAHLRLPTVFGHEMILRAARESIIIIDLTEAFIQLYEQERGNSHCLPRSNAHDGELKGDIQLEVSLHKGKFYPE